MESHWVTGSTCEEERGGGPIGTYTPTHAHTHTKPGCGWSYGAPEGDALSTSTHHSLSQKYRGCHAPASRGPRSLTALFDLLSQRVNRPAKLCGEELARSGPAVCGGATSSPLTVTTTASSYGRYTTFQARNASALRALPLTQRCLGSVLRTGMKSQRCCLQQVCVLPACGGHPVLAARCPSTP